MEARGRKPNFFFSSFYIYLFIYLVPVFRARSYSDMYVEVRPLVVVGPILA